MSIRSTKVYQIIEALDSTQIELAKKNFLQEIPDTPALKLFLILADSVDREHIPERSEVIKQVFGKQEPDIKLRRLSSSLFHLLEKVIASIQFEKDSILQELMILRGYREMGAEKLFDSKSQAIAKKLEQYTVGERRAISAYFHEDEVHRFLDNRKDRSIEPNLQKMMDTLDTFYIGSKLKIVCEMQNHASVLDYEYRIDQVNALISKVSNDDSLINPYISVYKSIFEMLNRPAETELMSTVIKLGEEHKEAFAKEDLRDIYLYCANSCIKQIVGGNEEMLERLLVVYQKLMENDLLLEAGVLSPWTFKNIVTAGLRAKNYEYVFQFIDTYVEKLDERYRKDAHSYSLASLHFARGAYSEVLENLQNVKYQDVFYALDSRALLLKTYYHLGEFEALQALCESFRIFILRHPELSETRKKNFNNLIRITKGMTKAVLSDKISVLKKFQNELDNGLVVSDKSWLRRQLQASLEKLA